MKMSQYMKAKEQEPESEGFINMEQQTEQLPIEEEESIIEEGGEVV